MSQIKNKNVIFIDMVLHAPQWHCRDWIRVVNGPHFEVPTRPEHEIAKPNPARAQHLVLKPNLGPKAKFTEWVKICATARCWWRSKVNITN